jgi:hypothetical protein
MMKPCVVMIWFGVSVLIAGEPLRMLAVGDSITQGGIRGRAFEWKMAEAWLKVLDGVLPGNERL